MNFDGRISSVVAGWNVVGLPYNDPVLKSELLVDVGGIEYSWVDAVGAGLVSDVLFGWDVVGQSYVFSDELGIGDGYWLYAFSDLLLKCPMD